MAEALRAVEIGQALLPESPEQGRQSLVCLVGVADEDAEAIAAQVAQFELIAVPARPQHAEAVAQCFKETALVTDEGRTYCGRAAIKLWKIETSAKYQYTIEPFACEPQDGKVVVTSRLTGDFLGSPVNLRFFFGLDCDKIASLEIIP